MMQETVEFLASAGQYGNNLFTLLQTDIQTNTSSLNFYRPDALPGAQAQPTVSVIALKAA